MKTVATMELKDVVKKIDDAFTIPTVIQKVLEVTASTSANAKKVARVIEEDPVFSAKILRTCNSSFFGFIFRTSNIRDAVVRLGIRQIRSLAMALSVSKFFSGGEETPGGFSRVNVWRHSVAVGIMNELLAGSCALREARAMKSDAMLAGLLHDIGIIFEEQHMHDQFHDLVDLSTHHQLSLNDVEKKKIGFSHAELGQEVLKRWRLPSHICYAVGNHHTVLPDNGDLLTQLTSMSEYLVTARGVGYCDVPVISRSHFGRLQMRLGLIGKTVVNLRARFEARLKDAAELLSLHEEKPAEEEKKVTRVRIPKRPKRRTSSDTKKPS